MSVHTMDLKILLIEVTQKCNANCDQCGSRCDGSGEDLLTKEDIIRVLEDIKEHLGIDTMINITGGEPLMRRDLFDIMAEVSKLGFDWGMVTNGTLITDQVIKNMKESGMKTITISLDGMERTHETLRHLPGSFRRIIKNIIKLKREQFLDYLQVTFTANSRNVYEIEELYALLNRIGIDSIRTSFIDPIGRAEDKPELLLDKEQMQWLMRFANEKNKSGGIPVIWGCPHYLGGQLEGRNFYCFSGRNIASILYNGDIFVCPNVPRLPALIQGNIRTDCFSDVWLHAFGTFRQKHAYEYCKGCRHSARCRGDSLHTFDFENNRPKFCYRDIFEKDTRNYEAYLQKEYRGFELIEIDARDASAACIYVEPEACAEMRNYFHVGKRHPSSMFEQQMGLVGFKVDENYVIRYVFPSHINRLAADLAVFHRDTLKQAERETKIIKRNVRISDDKKKLVSGELRFLGFAHSHPAQRELQYSMGDERIHKKLVHRYGDYIGILFNPIGDLIGAYYGKDIRQANLKLLSGGKQSNRQIEK